MNHAQHENLANGKAKDGNDLEFRFQSMDCNKALLIAAIAKSKPTRVRPKSKIDDDEEQDRAYRFYGGKK